MQIPSCVQTLPLRRFSLALSAAVVFAASATPLARADSNFWETSRAKPASDGKPRVPGTGGRTLTIEDPAIVVVEDAGAPGGKALEFSGNQTKMPIVGRPYEGGDSLTLSLHVKPAPGKTDKEQTVLMHPGVFELRYSSQRQDLTLYLPQKDPKNIVFARVPLRADEWSNVEVSVTGGQISLKSNNATDAKPFPDGASLQSAKSFLRIGMSVDAGRPFVGRLADITVTEPGD